MDNRIKIMYSSSCLQHPLYFIEPFLFLDYHYTPLFRFLPFASMHICFRMRRAFIYRKCNVVFYSALLSTGMGCLKKKIRTVHKI